MRKLTTQTFVSLDGVMQAPGGPDEDTSSGFAYGGWTFPHWDEIADARNFQRFERPFDLLLGRKTYDIFAAYWPTGPEPIAGIFNRARKWVASRTLERADWENSEILRDAARDVAELKRQDGPELLVIGSGDLIQTLLAHDLVDEMHVMTFPVLLGSGKRLFGDGTRPAGLTMTSSAVSPSGVVSATYVRTGEVGVGTFG